jgi:methanogenic corrinoid protein MtbC1
VDARQLFDDPSEGGSNAIEGEDMESKQLLAQLTTCVERGKADKNAPFPPDLKGQDGAIEITQQLLDAGVPASDILQQGLMPGMSNIGQMFSDGKAFVPQLLIAARAMNSSMTLLKPFFDAGAATYRGDFIIGTVAGDLHDIGKNLVRMVLEGDGWKVTDLGTDVTTEQFLAAIKDHPGCMVGMSALLTTTMLNMAESVKTIKAQLPATKIFVGGAPLTQEFNDRIGADGYFPDPHQLARHVASLVGA